MKGLSRMRGNSHVRFLGEGLAVMPSSYPIRPLENKQKFISPDHDEQIAYALLR